MYLVLAILKKVRSLTESDKWGAGCQLPHPSSPSPAPPPAPPSQQPSLVLTLGRVQSQRRRPRHSVWIQQTCVTGEEDSLSGGRSDESVPPSWPGSCPAAGSSRPVPRTQSAFSLPPVLTLLTSPVTMTMPWQWDTRPWRQTEETPTTYDEKENISKSTLSREKMSIGLHYFSLFVFWFINTLPLFSSMSISV